MSPAAEKLLQRMRQTKNGWGPDDFATLYGGFGFTVHEGGSHTIYIHETYKQLRATVGRHGTLAPGYAQHAVKIITQLKKLEADAAAQAAETDDQEAEDDDQDQ